MAEESLFRGTLSFLVEIGIYDVVLPFLLIFTIVFAILEKTKVLGVEKIDNKEYTKKNLNAIVAFVVAFFFVASSRLVAIVSQALAQTVILIILFVFFLMLVGVFLGSKEVKFERKDPWMKFFMVVAFICIVLIFFNALGWLSPIIKFISFNYKTDWIASLILLIVIIGILAYIIREKKPEKKEEKKEG